MMLPPPPFSMSGTASWDRLKAVVTFHWKVPLKAFCLPALKAQDLQPMLFASEITDTPYMT